MNTLILLLINVFITCSLFATHPEEDKTVLVAILARNKAHVLPKYLRCIENLDYPKDKIRIYINTNNNVDATEELLSQWVKKQKPYYKEIFFESHDIHDIVLDHDPHNWNSKKFKVLAQIRNKSLKTAKETRSDFYFVVDCDNFIAPYTLRDLIVKDKPIIAPMLRAIPEQGDYYSNFFCAVDPSGYYKHDPLYEKILLRKIVGTFPVPVVHCTYLIKADVLDKLSYIDGSHDYEFVIFSRMARQNEVAQWICNEKEYGTLIHFFTNHTLEQEQARMASLLMMP
jgi:hypothetical protein